MLIAIALYQFGQAHKHYASRSASVCDLLVDDRTWLARHLVVDTEGLLADNKVKLPTKLVKEVLPLDQEITFPITRYERATSVSATFAPPVSAHHNEPKTATSVEHDPHLRSAAEIGE